MNRHPSGNRQVLVLLPSIRISGGIKEVLRLAEELAARNIRIRVLSLWKHTPELSCPGLMVDHLSDFVPTRSLALLQLPILMLRFLGYVRRVEQVAPAAQAALLVTHYSTFPFAWLFPGRRWLCFNQDVEWMFVPKGVRRSLLRRAILATSRRAEVVTTNEYLEERFCREGIRSVGVASIWPPAFWLSEGPMPGRDIDVAMVLRRGHMKRSDLYFDMLGRLKQAGITCAVVTPDKELHERSLGLAGHCLLDAGNHVPGAGSPQLKAIFRRSRVFLLLSETEGFGLPPLEAMGSGCVPLCRDSGGPRCYMQGPLAANLVPLAATCAEVFARLADLLADPQRLEVLSMESRRRFQAGFAVAAAAREQCMDRLAECLNR
jgi:glycosyltransferase involved in cell wall biosynthesis